MPTTIAQFNAEVSQEIARGTAFDARIPSWAKRSIARLEQGHTFGYMKQLAEVTFDLLSETPHIVDLASDRVKSVIAIRSFNDTAEGARAYDDWSLRQVELDQILSIDIGWPQGYALIGGKLFFDAVPSDPTHIEVQFNEYTDWPTDPAAMPTILQQYSNIALAATLHTAFTSLKDWEAAQVWQQQLAMDMQMVGIAETEAKWAGRKGMRVGGGQ